jgi:hypothetical protein
MQVRPGDILDIMIDVRLHAILGSVVKNINDFGLQIEDPQRTFSHSIAIPQIGPEICSQQHICRTFARKNGIRVLISMPGSVHVIIDEEL